MLHSSRPVAPLRFRGGATSRSMRAFEQAHYWVALSQLATSTPSIPPSTSADRTAHVNKFGNQSACPRRRRPYFVLATPFLRTTMVHQFRRHPLKGLYLCFELTTTLCFRLPSWILGNIPRKLRPRQSWSLKKSVLIKALDRFNVVLGRWDAHALSWLCGH
jgi:hypothetical protein